MRALLEFEDMHFITYSIKIKIVVLIIRTEAMTRVKDDRCLAVICVNRTGRIIKILRMI